jgi:flagellar motor switch protein FliG
MEAMGAVRLKDVDEAQAGVVKSAKALADSGEIVISSGGEEDELVY